MADIGDDFFSFGGNVPNATSPDKGSAVHGSADGLWAHNPAQETYEGTDGVITHIAAKASGSCPYMRELLGLPPLPASTEHTSPKIERLNQSFENSPTTTATAPHQYHQHHPPAGERPLGGCPYRGGKIDTAPLAAINLPPASEVLSKSAADAVIEGRCPVTGKVGPLPKGHPMPPASASVHSPNTTASGIAAVAVGIPRQAVADVTESHKCPFINVFASHIDSYLHRALMTSVLNRITLKSFLREKKVLQRFAINSSAIRKGDTSSAAAVSDIGDTDTNIPSASGTDAQGNPLPPDIDESAASVLRLTAEETEAKCGEILKEYISNGTARPRAAAPAGNDDDGDGSPAANAPPKLTPAVAAIIAAAAANAAHIPPALRAPNTGGNAALSSVPASSTSTPTLKPRRIGEIGESEDATVGATPSAVASMLSSMRLGREVSLPMALSFLNQATNRSEERFMDMYMRVVAEACGIKPSPLPPPLRPPPRMVGPDGQPNPAAMMVLVPPTSLLTKAIADGNLPSVAVSAMPPMSSQPQVPPVGLPPHSATSTPKTFLHDVLTSLFVPRMQHFYALWLHAVEHYEGLSLASTSTCTDDTLANEDALNRVSVSAQNVLHCIRCYSKMLHYHIMDPQSMKAVIDDLINKADQFVTARKQKLQLANMIHNGNSNSIKVHPYPSAHRFFALATILAIRESLPFRSFIAMETGDGAALRESIVAELIRGDKLVAPMDDLPPAAVSVLERPGYAHTTSLRNCIKTALYVTALATISPVAVAGQTPKVPSPTGQNAKALPTAGRPNGTPTPANHKSGSPNSEQPKPQARPTTVGSNVPGHILQMAASAVPYQPVHQQQTIPQQQQVWHPGNGTQFTPYGPYPTAYAQPQLVYPTVHQGHPFMVPFEPFMQPQTYAHQYTMGNERQFMAVQPMPQQHQPLQEQLPQQRSQVPPFYNTPSSAQSPATPMPPVPSGHLHSNVSTPTTDGTGSIYGQLQQSLIEQHAHHASPVDPASLKCPFLRNQFPAGAPAIIPTSPHNQQSQDSSVSSIPHGPAAIGGTQTITASAAPFYPMVQPPTGQPPPASNNPFAMYYPVIAPQELIAPVYQPKGNGIAIRPPPYKQ